MKMTSQRKRRFIQDRYEEQDGLCFLCGQLMILESLCREPRTATIDHLVPLCKGGTWRKDNLVLACYKCNHSKGDIVIPISILNDKDHLYKIFQSQKIYKVAQTW